MAIKLDIFKKRKNTDNYRNFTYADIHLDIQFNTRLGAKPTGISKNAQDLKVDYDTEAIYNSRHNAFNTKKGQKILNPNFGLDLEQYLFDNISKENGDLIGTTIFEELPLYEPRIKVTGVDVLARPDWNEYVIDISITIPSLNNQVESVNGTLTTKGFQY